MCLSDFEDPRALPCLHTFCFGCLVRLCQPRPRDNTLKCPICQEHHGIPLNGTNGFRQDFRIKSFIEMKKNEGNSVRPTLCQRHPHLELTHVCPEVDCKSAVLCIYCVRQNHRNHQTIPLKSICESKLSHIKVMEDAIEQNREQVQSARKKLEENKSEMHDLVRRRLDEFHAQLDEEAGRNVRHIERTVSQAHDDLTLLEEDIQTAENELRELKDRLSDTIPNIVNGDKYLDEDLNCLYEKLNKWTLRYSLLKFVDLDIKNMKKNWVVTMPEQSVKGVSVALYKRTLDTASAVQTSPVAITLPLKRKAQYTTSDSSLSSSDDDDL